MDATRWMTHGAALIETRSSGAEWHPQFATYMQFDVGVSERLTRATPPNSVLLQWARQVRNQTPQSWWDETIDLFTDS